MSKFGRVLFFVLVGFYILPGTSAAVVQYDYSATVQSETRGDQIATLEQQLFSFGDLISGSFTYDSGVSSLPEDILGSIYFAMTNLVGSISDNSFSDSAGVVAVLNDFDPSPDNPGPLIDFLSITTGLDGFDNSGLNGFSVINGGTTFELVAVRLFWLEISDQGFLEDESLPDSLPPMFNGPGFARLELDFVDVNDETNTHTVTADPLLVTAVPVPAAIWMLLGALGMLGAANSRRKASA